MTLFLFVIPDDFERRSHFDRVLARLGQNRPEIRSRLDLSLSLFEEKPIFVLDELETWKKEEIERLMATPLDLGTLILGARSKIASLHAWVAKQGQIVDLSSEKPWERDRRLLEALQQKSQARGKKLQPEAAAKLFDRLDRSPALLESELEKLLAYVADRPVISVADVEAVSAFSRSYSLFQVADELAWENKLIDDQAEPAALVPLLRQQYQMGLKIALCSSLKEAGAIFPRLFPKTLERRFSQSKRLGAPYFQRALDRLFLLELSLRSLPHNPHLLLDEFRCHLA
jgi:DNA polymerase III delta subunit